jgi:polysaccharide pyruvyl transferase WcaK-like protein
MAMSSCHAIFTRDEMSTKCCNDMGFGEKTIETIDVAFALPYQTIHHSSEKFKVGINVSGLLYNGGYNRRNYFGLSFSYAQFIHKLIQRLLKMDIEVHLVPHVISDVNQIEDDYAVCYNLLKIYEEIKLAPRVLSPIAAKSYLAGLDMFTGARMHSTIAAFSSGVPVIPIAYSRKFNGLFNTLQYPYYIDAKADYSIDSAMKKFFFYMGNIEDLQRALLIGKQKYIERLINYKSYISKLIEEVREK